MALEYSLGSVQLMSPLNEFSTFYVEIILGKSDIKWRLAKIETERDPNLSHCGWINFVQIREIIC